MSKHSQHQSTGRNIVPSGPLALLAEQGNLYSSIPSVASRLEGITFPATGEAGNGSG